MGALTHAVLILNNSEGEGICIPVLNFPLLPIGSRITIHLKEKTIIEEAKIVEYQATNKYGPIVKISIREAREEVERSREIDKIWDSVAALCQPDMGMLCELLYPDPIDFSTQYPPA